MEQYFTSFLKIFVVINAIGGVPAFLLLSDKLKDKEKNKAINEAILIAGALLLVFLFFGIKILNFFGVSLTSFQMGGGIIIALFGLKFVLGIDLREQHAKKYDFAVVPLATPLITGPGAITTVILLVQSYGYQIALIASLSALLASWLIFRNSIWFYRIFGRQGIEVVSKVFALILVAIGIEFFTHALKAMS
jgi:multiple antibiotic resistance protein